MIEQEAIYCLKAQSECHSEICDECSLYGETGTDHCYQDAFDMAIKALERQVPKKVIERLTRGKNEVRSCPCCINFLNPRNAWEYDYCPMCGQKLDWSEEE